MTSIAATISGPAGSGNSAFAGRALRRLFRTLYLRGRSSRGLSLKGAPKSVGRRLLTVLIFYGLFGGLAVAFFRQPVFTLALYLHLMTFVFLGMFVSSSAGEVLFNKEEADILLHRPVTPQALLWAKISVLVEISLWIAGSFNLVGLVVGFEMPGSGWRFPIIHAVSMVLEALFCTACVVLVYQMCIRWFGRERLEGIMTTAQILVAISAMLIWQIMPRIALQFSSAAGILEHSWWVALLPPAWFAGFDDAFAGAMGGKSLMLAATGVAATAGVVWLAFIKLARDYQTGLQRLLENVSPRPAKAGGRSRRRMMPMLVNLPPLKWWLRDPVSRGAFLLTAAYLARDRETKLRIYPSLAPILVVPFIFLFQGPARGGMGGTDFGVAFSGAYLGIVPLMAVTILQYSQQWQAADVFRVAPVFGPGALCDGARRAVLLFLGIPLAVAFVVLAALLMHGATQLPMLLPGILAMPVYAILPALRGKGVPFSVPTEEGKAANRGLVVFGAMLFAFALAGLATLAQRMGFFWWFLLGEALAAAGIYGMMRAKLAKKRWRPLE